VAVVAPAVPATTVPQANTTGQLVDVAISANGATITNVSIIDQAGVSHTMGTAAGSYLLPPGYSIVMTYTVATPTWIWTDPLMAVGENLQFGGYAAENLVLISQLLQLPLTAHAEGGQAGLGAVVSN
jgi:hypothetical protein